MRAGATVVAVAALTLPWIAPAMAGTVPEHIEMFTGDTHVIEVDARRVAVGNGRVLSASQVEGRHILLLAESAGTSALEVWTRDGVRHAYVVNVLEFSGAPLYEEVQRLLDGTRQIGARLVGDRIVLEGHRVSDGDRERVAAIVKAFPGRVFDFIDRVGWDVMIHLQVSILEVRHSALDGLGIRWDAAMAGPSLQVDSSRSEGRFASVEWNSQLSSIIELLRQRGAQVFYNDPFFATVGRGRHYDLNMTNTPLENLGQYDAVVIVTDHSDYDYKRIVKESQLVVDSRNACKGINSEKIVRC